MLSAWLLCLSSAGPVPIQAEVRITDRTHSGGRMWRHVAQVLLGEFAQCFDKQLPCRARVAEFIRWARIRNAETTCEPAAKTKNRSFLQQRKGRHRQPDSRCDKTRVILETEGVVKPLLAPARQPPRSQQTRRRIETPSNLTSMTFFVMPDFMRSPISVPARQVGFSRCRRGRFAKTSKFCR